MTVTSAFVFAALSLGTPTGDSGSSQEGPTGNILILIADDIGVDGLNAYGLGTDLPSTPNLDALAADGMRFDSVWANPVCSPTRASLQTGRYVFRTDVGYAVTPFTNALKTNEITLPEMLEVSGLDYDTAAFGKWHLGNPGNGGTLAPNVAGYDHYAGALINLHPPENYNQFDKTTNGSTEFVDRYITSDEVNDARDWINSRTKPWLAYVAFHAPHSPHHTPPADLHTVDLSGAGPPQTDPRPYWKAMVQALDAEIGRLFSEIELDYQDTTVIFLGDNGTTPAVIQPPFDPNHGKGSAYEGGINVPMIVAGPGILPGTDCRALINVSDIFATVADITGAVYPPLLLSSLAGTNSEIYEPGLKVPLALPDTNLDSVSFRPYFQAPNLPSIRTFNWSDMYCPSTDVPPTIIRQAIRNNRYKLLMRTTPTVGDELFFFDLTEDPLELVNLLELQELTNQQREAFMELVAESDSLLSGQ